MTSLAAAPALSFGEGTNGLDALFSTISPFSDADPIMRGLRDGTLSWGEAAELEEAEALASYAPIAPIAPPARAAWVSVPALVRQNTSVILPAPITPPRPQRVTFACPGAPKKPVSGKVVKTLIVRNLPRTADDLEVLLRNTFEPYGAVRDVYIPKNMDASSPYFGTIKGFALVKFAELSSAEAAAFTAGSLRIGRNNLAVEFAKEDR
jgi:hypothetical protein